MRHTTFLRGLGFAVILTAAGCKSLDITNPNDPDGDRALSDPEALESFVGGASQTWFNTSRTDRWETAANRCHVNWAILDSDWEAEFCRVAESHPKVRAYVKNHNLGFTIPYALDGEEHQYIPDFIACIDDGHGPDDLLNLLIEVTGEKKKDKAAASETSSLPDKWNRIAYRCVLVIVSSTMRLVGCIDCGR